jgi:hypothetical protein
MLNEKYKYDLEYAKGMKKIYELNAVVTSEGSLASGTHGAREYFICLNHYYLELANNIKTEILEPAKKVLEDQNTLGKKLYNDIKKYEKDYKDAVANMEKLKIKFLNLAKQTETCKLDAELAKASYIPQPEKEKFNSKANNMLKDLKEAERVYINSINQANNARVMFIEGGKSVLFNFQLLEEEFIENTKILLNKFFIYSNSTYKNTLYDTERVIEKVNLIDTSSDVQNFIAKNQSSVSPPLPIEYVPYSLMLRSKPIEEFNYPS